MEVTTPVKQMRYNRSTEFETPQRQRSPNQLNGDQNDNRYASPKFCDPPAPSQLPKPVLKPGSSGNNLSPKMSPSSSPSSSPPSSLSLSSPHHLIHQQQQTIPSPSPQVAPQFYYPQPYPVLPHQAPLYHHNYPVAPPMGYPYTYPQAQYQPQVNIDPQSLFGIRS